jgi:hypothetical protein
MSKSLVLLLQGVAQLRERKSVTEADWEGVLDSIEQLDALIYSRRRLKMLGENKPKGRIVRLEKMIRSCYLELVETVSRILLK